MIQKQWNRFKTQKFQYLIVYGLERIKKINSRTCGNQACDNVIIKKPLNWQTQVTKLPIHFFICWLWWSVTNIFVLKVGFRWLFYFISTKRSKTAQSPSQKGKCRWKHFLESIYFVLILDHPNEGLCHSGYTIEVNWLWSFILMYKPTR